MQVKPFSEASADHVRVTVKEFLRKLTRRWEQQMKLGVIIRTLLFFFSVKTEELGTGKAWSWVGKGSEFWGLADCSEIYSENVNWFRKMPISPTCPTTYSVENGTFP